MSEVHHYRCYYTKEWPLDEYGRIGGLYSLVDIPIATVDRISRPGIVEAKNEENQMYKVRDVDLNKEFWVPMADVEVGEYVETEN
tara:strand:- start:246 stop:500 length:255 start_codon:yes stop_codon:yes gene_type:complete